MSVEQDINPGEDLEPIAPAPGTEGDHPLDDPDTLLEPGEGDEDDLADGENDDTDDDDELDTIELNGRQYQVPKALKAGYMMQADYTRKTQETSAKARELEARAAELDQQSQVDEEVLRSRAQLLGIEDRLSQYEKVDWNALERQDPMAAQTHWRTYQQLKDQRQAAQQTISEREAERTRSSQQDFAKRIEETRQYAQTKIKGWSPEVDRNVQQFAIEQDISPEFLQRNMSPKLYDILHKAWLGDRALKKQQSAVRAKPTTPLQETRTVGGKASAGPRKSLSQMSTEEYVAFRNAQEKRQARR